MLAPKRHFPLCKDPEINYGRASQCWEHTSLALPCCLLAPPVGDSGMAVLVALQIDEALGEDSKFPSTTMRVRGEPGVAEEALSSSVRLVRV